MRTRSLLGVLFLTASAACGGSADERTTSSATRPSETTTTGAPGANGTCYEARREPGAVPVAFADVTDDAGLTEPLRGIYGHATAVGDVNGDGWSDLFVGGFADKTVNGPTAQSVDHLLLGGPEGFHADDSFTTDPGRTSGAVFADLDGDGDLDLALSRNYRDSEGGRAPSVVLRNDGGRFTQASVLDARRGGRSFGVLDYDGDGRLDLYLSEDRFSGGSSVLLHNDGGLRFTDATTDAGLPTNVHGLGVGASDLNGDGWPDLFVSDSNRLFVNRGNGTFEEVSTSVFTWERIGDEDDQAGVAVGDVNRDGRIDILVGQHYNSTLDRGARVAVRLYVNDGNDAGGTPRFRDVTEQAGLVPLPTKAPHVEIVDLDNDGWPDILTTASAANGTRPAIFRSLGVEDGIPHFETPTGAGDPKYWIAGATLDVDHDGDLDAFLVEWDPQRSSRLLRNVGSGGHWLAVRIGPTGAAGVGAVVDVARSGGLDDASQLLGTRVITASTGFGSGSEPIAFFGLGAEAAVDVRVTLPGVATSVVVDRSAVDRSIEVAADGSDSGAPCSG